MTGPLDNDAVDRALRDQRLREWARGCLSKVRHPNEDEAIKASRRVNRRYGQRQRPYECPHCDGWHLTSKPHGGDQ